jgi:hypothetical protein
MRMLPMQHAADQRKNGPERGRFAIVVVVSLAHERANRVDAVPVDTDLVGADLVGTDRVDQNP